ncbi:TIGR04222 domain-containing membrane protein [Spirillospora sp. NPDC049652]
MISADRRQGGAMDLYETAYLCGGADRVALVALVRAAQDDVIKIALARHRVTAASPAPPDGDADPMTAVVLAAIPSSGALLGEVRRLVAGSDAVAGIREELVARGLLRGRFRTSRGRRARTDLDPATPLERVAVLGEAGIADERLRTTFATSDPDLSGVRWLRRHPLGNGRGYGEYDPPDGNASGYGADGGGGSGGGW